MHQNNCRVQSAPNCDSDTSLVNCSSWVKLISWYLLWLHQLNVTLCPHSQLISAVDEFGVGKWGKGSTCILHSFHMKRTQFSFVRCPWLSQLTQCLDTFDPEVREPCLSVQCRLWSRHFDAGVQIGSRRWVVLRVRSISEDKLPMLVAGLLMNGFLPDTRLSISPLLWVSEAAAKASFFCTPDLCTHTSNIAVPHTGV